MDRLLSLLGNSFKERIKTVNGIAKHDAASLGFLVSMAHQDMIDNNVQFDVRPFLFTDEALDRGDPAAKITMTYFGNAERLQNRTERTESNCTFVYTEGAGYMKNGCAGPMMDALDLNPLYFANVIVLWTEYDFANGYYGLKNYFVGNGQAEIFQNGKHISGAWVRTDLKGRLVLLDENGEELKLQRGKTFFVVSNQNNELRIAE